MSDEKFDTRQYLGPFVNQLYIAELCGLDERVWEVFRAHAKERNPIKDGSRDYLIVRMMHIAESTSNAIRMDATWALIPPTMSLVRDRYEQTVRFSWLVRNPDQEEYDKYERFMFAKIRTVARDIAPETIKRFRESGQLLLWITEPLNKDDREYLEEWEKLDLKSMAARRDGFPPIADNLLSNEKLEKWYSAVYQQFSSVSHYDRFSIEMVSPQPHEGETVVMGLQLFWSKLLILYTTLLDIIQCYEATSVCFEQNTSIQFESLFQEWVTLAAKFEV